MKRRVATRKIWLTLMVLITGMAAVSARQQNKVPPELQPYVGARTVIDQSREELTSAFPDLKKHFSFTEDQSMLPDLLEKVGKSVEAFFANFPNTASVEDVLQDVLTSDGRLVERTRSKNNYLMTTRQAGAFGLHEYRTDPRGNEAGRDGLKNGFMESSLCAWHLVHFHPFFQSDSRFRYLGRSSSPPAYVIAFAQKPESARQVGEVGLWAPDVPNYRVSILIQGLAWVNPENYQIIRARTDLVAPRYDVGLTKNTTEIECIELHFEGVAQPFWLPREARVTSTFRSTTFRNRHRYSDYKLFTVESQDKVNPPVPVQPPP